MPEIPAHLAEKYGEEIFRAGMAGAKRRRSEQLSDWRPANRRPVVSPVIQKQEKPKPKPKSTRKAKTVKVWPLLGLRSIQNNKGGPWRLWVLARALDKPGSGVVLREDLQAYASELGIPRGTFRRWLASAKRLGLLVQKTRRNGEVILLMVSAERAAALIGCADVGTKRVQVPVTKLVGEKWRGNIWAAFITTLKGRPVSRRIMRKITSVPESTQQKYEKEAGIIQTVNYCHAKGLKPSHLAGVREYVRPHAFVWEDRRTKKKKKVIVWRCPDTREAPKGYSYAGRGRSRKVNNALSSSSFTGNHSPNYSGIIRNANRRAGANVVIRLFHNRKKSAEKAVRKFAKLDIPPYSDNAIHEVFYKKPGGHNCQQWTVIPTFDGVAC